MPGKGPGVQLYMTKSCKDSPFAALTKLEQHDRTLLFISEKQASQFRPHKPSIVQQNSDFPTLHIHPTPLCLVGGCRQQGH